VPPTPEPEYDQGLVPALQPPGLAATQSWLRSRTSLDEAEQPDRQPLGLRRNSSGLAGGAAAGGKRRSGDRGSGEPRARSASLQGGVAGGLDAAVAAAVASGGALSSARSAAVGRGIEQGSSPARAARGAPPPAEQGRRPPSIEEDPCGIATATLSHLPAATAQLEQHEDRDHHPHYQQDWQLQDLQPELPPPMPPPPPPPPSAPSPPQTSSAQLELEHNIRVLAAKLAPLPPHLRSTIVSQLDPDTQKLLAGAEAEAKAAAAAAATFAVGPSSSSFSSSSAAAPHNPPLPPRSPGPPPPTAASDAELLSKQQQAAAVSFSAAPKKSQIPPPPAPGGAERSSQVQQADSGASRPSGGFPAAPMARQPSHEDVRQSPSGKFRARHNPFGVMAGDVAQVRGRRGRK
jgi:hypothetical protein